MAKGGSMKSFKRVAVLGVTLIVMTSTNACGTWYKCLTSKSCAKEAENAATKDLFLRVVSLSLDSFRSVMSELGLAEGQQNTVITDVQSEAQQLTSQLALADSAQYSGTILENLSAMFQDLMEFAITKVSDVAPNVDKSSIMNSCAKFMNDMIANAGLVGILESLPVEEQVELGKDAKTGKLDWEVFRAPLERVTMSSFSGAVPTAEVGASLERFKRRPEDAPPPPAQVIAYRPSDSEKSAGSERLAGLCQGQPGDVGVGPGSRQEDLNSESVPLPGSECRGLRIDKKLAFCLFAPPEATKICAKTIYGNSAGATVSSIKIWNERTADTFTGFAAGRNHDCTVQDDRAALIELLTPVLQAKKSACKLLPPPRANPR